MNLVDDQAKKRVVAFVGEKPAEVNTTLFTMRMPPAVEREPGIRRDGLTGDRTAEGFGITGDIESVTVRIDELMLMTAAHGDAMVDMTDDMGTRRAVHVAFFRVGIVVEPEFQFRVERPLTGFVDDVDHRSLVTLGIVIAEICRDL